VADQHQLEVLQQGPDIWNTWRQQHPTTHPDLSYANLGDADFSQANLSFAHLSYANLNHAHLSQANLSYAHLFAAHLSQAHLSFAHLSYANLNHANLSSAHLNDANLSQAHLNDADLSSAIVGWTQFTDIDLRTVKRLETVEHDGPSSIGIDTIYRSEGHIPETFLRQAGVPKDFLTYIHSLVAHPIEYYTCFISYSSHDQGFAERLYTDLQSKGVRCWFAPEDIKIGDKIRQRIDESIRLYDKLLLVLSTHSVASWWVEYEVEKALAKERQEQRTMLFPIRLDEQIIQSTTDWAAHIKETRHIGDFTSWKDHDAY
jgi:hypothetical protein